MGTFVFKLIVISLAVFSAQTFGLDIPRPNQVEISESTRHKYGVEISLDEIVGGSSYVVAFDRAALCPLKSVQVSTVDGANFLIIPHLEDREAIKFHIGDTWPGRLRVHFVCTEGSDVDYFFIHLRRSLVEGDKGNETDKKRERF